MPIKKSLISEKILPSSVLDKNTETLSLYKETDDILKEVDDILEKISIALGKKSQYEYRFCSTQNCRINYHAIPSTTASYKI